MPVRDLTPGTRLDTQRNGVVVCIPLFGAHELFVRCLASVVEHTPADVTVLVADDAGPDPASRAWADELLAATKDSAPEVFWLRQPANLGFVGNVNAAFDACAPADVVVLNSDCEVADGWLEGLRAAALSDSLIATATALTNHGTIVSVPHRNHPTWHVPQELTFDDAAARVRARSPKLRPRIPTAIGHCMYVRRAAIDLVDGLDDAFAPAYGEEVDFSQRCLMHGLQHVVADDVLVLHKGGASLNVDGAKNPIQERHERLLRSRYPYYEKLVAAIEQDSYGPISRSLAAARQALLGRRITIDGRCLTRFATGTQVHTLELIHALWRTQDVRLRVVVPEDLGDYASHTLGLMPGVELLRAVDIDEGRTSRDDVVHRPYQLSSANDLRVLKALGERVVITQQDLIGYRNPSYFGSHREHEAYCNLTRAALAMADLVLFFSEHAASDCLADHLVEPERLSVVHIGTDHRLGSLQPTPAAPRGMPAGDDEPFLLCLGTDFRHKNRLFAIKLLHELRERHGWKGRLVLAGPRVFNGSSAGEEVAWLSTRPALRDAVVELPAVDEAEKAWLFEHAAALVYPSTYEGFGLVPFEAAEHGTACFWAPQASLTEVLPADAAVLVPWDAAASAAAVIGVLRDERASAALVERVATAGRALTWDDAAVKLIDAYDRVVLSPARLAGVTAAENARLEVERDEWELRYWDLRNQVGPTGMALVGPDGHLPETAQRALAGLARRRATRKPLLSALTALHRVGGGTRTPVAEHSQDPESDSASNGATGPS